MTRFLTKMAMGVAAGLMLAAGTIQAEFVAPEPEDLNMYFLMIDRFNNGDATNDSANPRANANYTSSTGIHGGDLEGIRLKLPYIKRLGCNGIWITPFVENVTDYHGYGAFNFYNVEPGFGDLAKLKQLVNEANDLGIAIYFDIVCGHQGNLIDSRDSGYPAYKAPPATYALRWRNTNRYPTPFNALTYFHAQGQIGNYVEPEQELGELSGLDDLQTETAYVRTEMTNIWKFWIQQTGVSGFRVDTVKHVDLGFWQEFMPAIHAEAEAQGRQNFFVFGEVYGADDNYMKKYIGTFQSQPYKFDAAVDFQFYNSAGGVFATANQPPSNIVNRLNSRASSLGSFHLKMPNFLDNHDVRRFLAAANTNPGAGLAERKRRLELGLGFLYTAPGIPVLYYGTEQGFDGGNDPANREDMFDGQYEQGPSVGDNFDENNSLYKLVAKLGNLRNTFAPLRRGTMTTHQVSTSGPGILVYTRRLNGEAVTVVMNTSTGTVSMSSFTVSEFAGMTVANVLNTAETLNLGGPGTFAARTLPAQAMEIWVASGNLPADQPDVTAFLPADGEPAVPLDTATAEIHFLLPMEHASTESAITFTPAMPYTVDWSTDSLVATLRFGATLEPRTTHTVTVGAGAKSATGLTMAVPRSATWTTARGVVVLPPLPNTVALKPTTLAIVADGATADWPAFPTLAANSSTVLSSNVYCYQDAVGDDTGAGAYTYPTDTAFTGGDADLRNFGFAYNATNLYFRLQPEQVNPAASFFTPYFGIALNTGSGGFTRALGFNQQTSEQGITELDVRSDIAPDGEATFTGPIGGIYMDAAGITTPLTAKHSQATGAIEIVVPRALAGIPADGTDKALDIVVYAGLETFGGTREVGVGNTQWEAGGGIVELSDPDVFDLAGSNAVNQADDLAGFDQTYHSLVRYSVLRFVLQESSDTRDAWMIY